MMPPGRSTRGYMRTPTPEFEDVALRPHPKQDEDVKPFIPLVPATPQRVKTEGAAAYPTPNTPTKRAFAFADEEDVKPQRENASGEMDLVREVGGKLEAAAGSSSSPSKRAKVKAEAVEYKPAVEDHATPLYAQAVKLPPPVIEPPPRTKGKVVVWDPYVKTILTTQAKQDYKVSQASLEALDRQAGKNSRGYAYFVYSESQVQEAAWRERGGEEYFEAYIQRLHENNYHRLVRLGKAGKMRPTLSLDEYPLKVVDYYENQDTLPDDYQDTTFVGSKPKNKRYNLDYDDCGWE